MVTYLQRNWRAVLALGISIIFYFLGYKAISLGLLVAAVVIISIDYLINNKEEDHK